METITKTAVKRATVQTVCPNCHTFGQTAGTVAKCDSCGLVAPVTAFSGATATRKYGAPRAWTIRGNVD